ncbi:MAG: 50S ribosomal protein L6 [Pseudomonadota bacterium]
MSRVGKNPVVIPEGVNCQFAGRELTVQGKLGRLQATLPPRVSYSQDSGQITFAPEDDSKEAGMMWGTARSVVANMVKGVSEGFKKRLVLEGVGYRAAVQGSELVLQLGFSHEIRYPMPEGIKIACEKPTLVVIEGVDRQKVGQVAAEIRSYRKPEPYKGKGVRYEGEYIFRKEGKKK